MSDDDYENGELDLYAEYTEEDVEDVMTEVNDADLALVIPLNPTDISADEMSLDLLQIFLRDVAKYPLLTGAQEVALAKRKEKGDKKAADALALHNLRMVIAVANRYHRGPNPGMGYLDLIQEGMIGLLRAVELYDYRKTNAEGKSLRFSTYAMWWIRQSTGRGLADKSRNIRVPMHVIEKLGKLNEAERDMRRELGREPTILELASRLGMKPTSVMEILRGTTEPISLNEKSPNPRDDSEDDNELGSALHDATTPSPHELVSREIDSAVLQATLARLSPRQQEILSYRYGLNGKEILSLTDIGLVWGITYQRVRQIELEVLAKLRGNADLQVLRED